jgi:hypothetical protein
VVLGVQLVVLTPAVGFETVTVMVVLDKQDEAATADETTGFCVETTAAGVDLVEHVVSRGVGTWASLVEGAALTTGATSEDWAGAGVYALEAIGAASLDEGASTALLDSAGLLTGAEVGSTAGAELGLGVTVIVGLGSGSEAPCLAGIMFCINDKSDLVTSKADSC